MVVLVLSKNSAFAGDASLEDLPLAPQSEDRLLMEEPESGLRVLVSNSSEKTETLLRQKISQPWIKRLVEDKKIALTQQARRDELRVEMKALKAKLAEDRAEIARFDDLREKCPICLNRLENDLVLTPCEHLFCEECLGTALEVMGKLRSCPLCRAQHCDSRLLRLNYDPEAKDNVVLESPSLPEELPVYAVGEVMVTPTGASFTRVEDHRIESTGIILTDGWKEPDRKGWFGQTIPGATWYSAIASHYGHPLLMRYPDAVGICHDPDEPLIGLPSPTKIHRLTDYLGKDAENDFQIPAWFPSLKKPFWAAMSVGYQSPTGFYYDIASQRLHFGERRKLLSVICIKRGRL